ncbi:MAG: hypothetical protein R3D25_08935 [Geminicoccaceae bacterium]
MVKDLTTALALAGRTETDVPLGRLAIELWREAGGDLDADADHTDLLHAGTRSDRHAAPLRELRVPLYCRPALSATS